jgi:hypothetical protein
MYNIDNPKQKKIRSSADEIIRPRHGATLTDMKRQSEHGEEKTC